MQEDQSKDQLTLMDAVTVNHPHCIITGIIWKMTDSPMSLPLQQKVAKSIGICNCDDDDMFLSLSQLCLCNQGGLDLLLMHEFNSARCREQEAGWYCVL